MSEAARARTPTAEGDCLVFCIPLRMKRRRGRRESILPAGGDATAAGTATNRGLAVALARAHRWRALLKEGRYATVGELARAAKVDNSYLACLLRLTLLAPDLVESILDGNEPAWPVAGEAVPPS